MNIVQYAGRNTTAVPKKFFFIVLIFMISNLSTAAQDFQSGLDLYKKGKFEDAALLFQKLNNPQGNLYAGKSYFSLGEYLKSKSWLNSIDDEASHDILLEARYTLALTEFELRQFDKALKGLHNLSKEKIRTQVVTNAIQLYNNILNYLTLDQRKSAFQSVDNSEIRYDLVRTAMGKVNYHTAKILLSQYKKSLLPDSASVDLEKLEKIVSDSLNYGTERAFGTQIKAPKGITYNIGVALPSYQPEKNEFKISQGLYNGYLLATEEFNQRNSNKKVFIRYKNTGSMVDSAGYAMTDFAWNYQIDAVLGPLFSEPAQKMATLAEEYQIPMLAPLANSDSLSSDNPYVFQANPTFASHGKAMARYAVQSLGMDTLAVLAERNSLGAVSAYAFREEAETLGAKVSYFFVENLKSRGYEVTKYTKYFTTNPALIDSMGYHHLDAVYAPFTGQAAPTLINLMLVDLKTMNSNLTVLGSQEWGASDISEDRLGSRAIYFSESYYDNQKTEAREQFQKNYSSRFNIEPNRFAMIGYDAANYLLQTLKQVENPALLKNALKTQPLYQGLIGNIKFNGSHVNQEVKIFKATGQGIQPAQ